MVSRAVQNAYQLSVIGKEAVEWLDETELSCDAGECVLSLDALISVGSKHLAVLEKFESIIASNPLGLKPSVPVAPLRQWIESWRAAAAEAEMLGLDRHISYKYWHHNIGMPDVVIRASNWFDTAEKLAEAVDTQRLRKFIVDGERQAHAVEASRDSWPRFLYLSIEQKVVRWHMLLSQWLQVIFPNRADLPTKIPISQQLRRAYPGLNTRLNEPAVIYEQMKMERRARKADMLKKRTCSHCGETGPLCQLSFAYCEGCRHSGIARIDLPRYCSEACQRAHWAAGHKNECPCVHENKEIVNGNGWLEQLARERAKRRK